MPVVEILSIAIPAAVQLISSLVDAFKGDPNKTAKVAELHDHVMSILGPEAAAEVEARLQREEAGKEALRIIAEARAATPAPIPPVPTTPVPDPPQAAVAPRPVT